MSLAEFATYLDAIGGFEHQPSVAVAVSGGPDSMALMLLADRWARQRGGQARGLTVDHGLRPESAAEVRAVGDWLAPRGIPHETLRWTDDKPKSGIQEAARDARYALLADWCRKHGVLHLLIAHQRQDQAETHLIRKRAKSGSDGLAGMPVLREISGCRLVRPLLSVSPSRLVAFLRHQQQPFLQDPSNLDPQFERGRLRVGSPPADDDVDDELHRFARQRIERERALDALIGCAVALHPAGFAALDATALTASGAATAERLLSRLAACIGTSRYPSRRERLGRLRTALLVQPTRARTLGGCRFVPWRGRILVFREIGAADTPVRLDPGARLVFDRRIAATHAADASGAFTLGYLGDERPPNAQPGPGELPGLVHSALPALWDEQGLAAVPHLGYHRPEVGTLPSLSFAPAKPLTTAGFTVV